MLDSINIFIILTAIANLLLGVIIYRSRSDNFANRLYSINVFFILCWLAGMVGYRLAPENSKLFAVTLLYLSPLFIPSTFLHFTYFFPVHEKLSSTRAYILYGATLFVAFLVVLPGVIIRGVKVVPGEESIILWGPYYFIYAIYFAGVFSYAFWRLFRKYLSGTALVRKQVIYLLIGYSIAANSGMVTNLIMPWLGDFRFNWLGQILTLFMVAPTAYAITQHGLFNVRVVATEVFAFAISFALLFNIFIPAPFVFQVVKTILFVAITVAGYLLVRSVLTEIKQKEQLAALSDQLEDANKQLKVLDETKSEFVSIASHQLRTPLTVIKGYISMMLEGSFGSIPTSQRGPLEKVYESGERLIQLVENLLSVSRIESGRMKYNMDMASLRDLAAAVVDELMPAAKKKSLALKFVEPHETLPLVNIDAEKIRQVMTNLVDNAIKYTKKGSVVVSVYGQDDPDNHVKRPSAIFTVQDTGTGVRADDQGKLFQKFIRGQGSALVHTEGTGLGLYVGRMMVEAHGGAIWVESKGENTGSTFAFAIPIPPPPKPSPTLALEEVLG